MSSINWKPGEVVTIYNQTLEGEVIVEGEAVLIRELNTHGSPLPGYQPRRWEVKFTGPYSTIEPRLVHTPKQVQQWKRALSGVDRG